MQQVVQRILGHEEVAVQAAAILVTFINRANIAAGAEGFLARALDEYRVDLRVGREFAKRGAQLHDHFQRQRIQRGRAIEGDERDAVADLAEDQESRQMGLRFSKKAFTPSR